MSVGASPEIKPIMTREETARFLRIGMSSLDGMISSGKIQVKRQGRRVLVLGNSVARFASEA